MTTLNIGLQKWNPDDMFSHEVLNDNWDKIDEAIISSTFRFPFTASDWLPAGPEEYRITVPLETHGKGPFAYISASNVENNDGDQENAVFGTRRTPRGDIIITSATPVAGEIFIKGAN